jgi:hypothetical protein
MVGMEMADEDALERARLDPGRQSRERALAEVQEDRLGTMTHEVGRAD